ncbi:DNA gyrase inhibitor YacG [Idiomarina sp. M1R2S28]|uniref:DNA gyrase inhibitor YacG n=1 Tax=Idiomarina rhizosphaerae TaxID=2961572 RepID=A0A9X2FZS7_9GAMM|nr:DNA gyrase inhibitor YacG [Idiomarina rhizosphaerae]MCP1338646.1 DNA gyrase inhibitor YacG [Idiomarina rhizosphaerae]
MSISVNCPTCQAKVEWSDKSPARPFCSERCKLIDLGEWANEEKSIPGEPVVIANDDYNNDEQDY